jgi:hypothetical protein
MTNELHPDKYDSGPRVVVIDGVSMVFGIGPFSQQTIRRNYIGFMHQIKDSSGTLDRILDGMYANSFEVSASVDGAVEKILKKLKGK